MYLQIFFPFIFILMILSTLLKILNISKNKLERLFDVVILIAMGSSIYLNHESLIFSLIFFFLTLLFLIISNLSDYKTGRSYFYLNALFLVSYLFSSGMGFMEDISLMGALSLLFIIVLYEEAEEGTNASFIKILIGQLILYTLVTISFISLRIGIEPFSYQNIQIFSNAYYGMALVFLYLSITFLLLFFPLMGLIAFINKTNFNLKVVFAISILYYSLLSKFVWIFQHLMAANLKIDFFINFSKVIYSLCFLTWGLIALSKTKDWRERLISLLFLNLSIIPFILILQGQGIYREQFQMFLNLVFISFIIWSSLFRYYPNQGISNNFTNIALFNILGIPAGALFFGKIFLWQTFEGSSFEFYYLFYVGITSLISFILVPEFLSQFKKDKLEAQMPYRRPYFGIFAILLVIIIPILSLIP